MGETPRADDQLSKWLGSDEYDDFVKLVSQGKTGEATDSLIGAVIAIGTGMPVMGAAVKVTSELLRKCAEGATTRLVDAYAQEAEAGAAEQRRVAFVDSVEAELRPWFLSQIKLLTDVRGGVERTEQKIDAQRELLEQIAAEIGAQKGVPLEPLALTVSRIHSEIPHAATQLIAPTAPAGSSFDRQLYAQRCSHRWGHIRLWGPIHHLLERFVIPDCRPWTPAGSADGKTLGPMRKPRLPDRGHAGSQDDLEVWLGARLLSNANMGGHDSSSRPRSALHEVSGSNKVILLGHAGAGKSALLRYVLLSLLDLGPSANSPEMNILRRCLPALIELNDVVRTSQHLGAPGALIQQWAADLENRGFVADRQSAVSQLRREASILLFDGLDEIGDPRTRNGVIEEIIGLQGTLPLARIVLTSRVADFDATRFISAGFRIVVLNDFSEKQIVEYLEKAAASRRPAISIFADHPLLEHMASSPHTRELAKNPLMLSLLEDFDYDVDRTRCALYSKLVARLAYEWDAERLVDTTTMAASAPGSRLADLPPQLHMDPVLRRLARATLEHQVFDIGLTREDVLAVVTDYCAQLGSDPFARQRVAREFQDFLLSRTAIVRPSPDSGRLRFVHRSFFEYLAGRAIADELNQDPSAATSNAVFKLLTAPSTFNPGSELVLFTCPYLPHTLTDSVLTHLCALPIRTDPASGSRAILERNMPDKPLTGGSFDAPLSCDSATGANLLMAWRSASEIDAGALRQMDDAPAALLRGLCAHWDTEGRFGWGSALADAVHRIAPDSWPPMPKGVRAAWLELPSWNGFEQDLVWNAVARAIWAYDDAFVEDLLSALSAAPWRRRRRLAMMVLAPLALAGVTAAINAVLAMSGDDTHPVLRALACKALSEVPRRDLAFERLVEQFAIEGDSKVRAAIVRSLGLAFADRDETRAILMRSAADDARTVRRAAAHELGHAYGRTREVRQFLDGLAQNEADEAVKKAFGRALNASQDSQDARDTVIDLVRRSNGKTSAHVLSALRAASEADEEEFDRWSWTDDGTVNLRLLGDVFNAVAKAGIGLSLESLEDGGKEAVQMTEALVATAAVIVAADESELARTPHVRAALREALAALGFAPWQAEILIELAFERRSELLEGPLSTCIREVDAQMNAEDSSRFLDALRDVFGDSATIQRGRAIISG